MARGAESHYGPLDGYYIALTVISFAFIFLCLRIMCDRMFPEELDDELEDALYDNNIDEHGNANRIYISHLNKSERRAFILRNVVQKKAKKCETSEKLMLPHESMHSIRSSNREVQNIMKSIEDEPDTDADTEEETYWKRKKDDIIVKSFREFRASTHGVEDDEENQSSLTYEPESCVICMQRYKNGDDICFSQNEKCFHAFHTECIVPWLMQHENCPMCREGYFRRYEDVNNPVNIAEV